MQGCSGGFKGGNEGGCPYWPQLFLSESRFVSHQRRIVHYVYFRSMTTGLTYTLTPASNFKISGSPILRVVKRQVTAGRFELSGFQVLFFLGTGVGPLMIKTAISLTMF